jgi:hypothetical protein
VNPEHPAQRLAASEAAIHATADAGQALPPFPVLACRRKMGGAKKGETSPTRRGCRRQYR